MHKKKPTAAQGVARNAKKTRLFGANPVCAICLLSDPPILTEVNRTLLEEHHVFGRNHNRDVVIPLCLHHHALMREGCQIIGADMHSQRSLLERIAEMYRIRSVFDRAAADMAVMTASKLDRFVEALDNECPNWRSINEAEKE